MANPDTGCRFGVSHDGSSRSRHMYLAAKAPREVTIDFFLDTHE
jgi:hypothetical protein